MRRDVRPAMLERIDRIFPDNPAARQTLYQLRGLLVHRILLLSLKKRRSVQYELASQPGPDCCSISSKRRSSRASRMGHPDVTILLTCLAFCYGDLDFVQLCQSLYAFSEV